jgi:hypothetical protein
MLGLVMKLITVRKLGHTVRFSAQMWNCERVGGPGFSRESMVLPETST